jgi:ribonuclease Y
MEWIFIIIAIAAAVVFGVGGFFVGSIMRKKSTESTIGSAQQEATRIVEEATKSAEAAKKEAVLQGKEAVQKLRENAEKEANDRRKEVQRQERRIVHK